MINKLFGAQKKKDVKEAAPYEGPTLTETSSKLGERSDVLQTKVNGLNQELMDIKKQMLNAKGMKKKQLQQKAMHILKRRKMYDAQLGNLQNQQFNVDQVAFANESIQDTLNTVSIFNVCFSFCNYTSGDGYERSEQSSERANGQVRHGRS